MYKMNLSNSDQNSRSSKLILQALASNPSWSHMMKPISILVPHSRVHMKYRYQTLQTGFITQTSVPLTPIYSPLTLAKVLMFNENNQLKYDVLYAVCLYGVLQEFDTLSLIYIMNSCYHKYGKIHQAKLSCLSQSSRILQKVFCEYMCASYNSIVFSIVNTVRHCESFPTKTLLG